MPRQARLDSAGTLHHIILRGIEKRQIFDADLDRQTFANRRGQLALETGTKIYAWSLMTKHAHLLMRSGSEGLPQYMRRLLMGYAKPIIDATIATVIYFRIDINRLFVRRIYISRNGSSISICTLFGQG
jgi:REP element-mobilizing transposase RayT